MLKVDLALEALENFYYNTDSLALPIALFRLRL